MEDYLATNRFWRREIASSLNLPPSVAEVLLGAHGELLETAFAAIVREYGSVDFHLAQAIGLDASALARLEDRLLEAVVVT